MYIVPKYYYDSEVLDQMYCDNVNCHSCEGSDQDGEPNGYGCEACEAWAEKQIKSGEYAEIGDTGFDYLFVKLEDYDRLEA